ncbi:MAG: phage holin family protein [Proteobacteria bacterium]|nr:phage holin family protein [Pseudomonadota bacterium]
MHNSINPNLIQGLVTWILNAIALMFTANIIRGIHISGFFVALMAALVLSAANTILLPILTVLTLPLTVVTLGIFWFFLYGAMLKLSAALIPGFSIDGWLPAIFGALLLALVQGIFHFAFKAFT